MDLKGSSRAVRFFFKYKKYMPRNPEQLLSDWGEKLSQPYGLTKNSSVRSAASLRSTCSNQGSYSSLGTRCPQLTVLTSWCSKTYFCLPHASGDLFLGAMTWLAMEGLKPLLRLSNWPQNRNTQVMGAPYLLKTEGLPQWPTTSIVGEPSGSPARHPR